ncbi:hypothetical protein [Paractinoplanes globisporus]|uniref:Uncharacterized protein n=1 Tax=Paractinoplanes globisporus TaxID=113565 RepID=A0ABW6W6Q3_9ACTN|nr:hypothetical protein [Actinoplanes globisporus]
MAGLALAVPTTFSAAPAASAAVSDAAATEAGGLRPGPIRLQDGLLSASDLPRGYSPAIGGTMAAVSDLGADSNICDHQVSSHGHVATAQATFIHGIPGPMLFETLSATGPRTARAIVAGIAAAPRLCKSFNDGVPGSAMRARLTISPLRVPRLGDASAGLSFMVRPAGVNMTIQGRLISVARRGVAVTILLVNSPQGNQRELNLIAATAIRKLDRAS